MEAMNENLDAHLNSEAFVDCMERFEMWSMTREDVEDGKIVFHSVTFIGKDAYSLLKIWYFQTNLSNFPMQLSRS